MTTNDSSTGGYLVPASTGPLEDDALIDFLQTVVVGITGIAGRYVRPRWQEEPPNLPPRNVSWAAIGVTDQIANAYPYVEHESGAQGTDTAVQNETFKLDCSFYGPLAETNAGLLRDGLAIAQNREQLFLAGMALVAVPATMTQVPTLLKERWLRRVDMPVMFAREIRRTYPVLNLLSAVGTIRTDTGLSRAFNAH